MTHFRLVSLDGSPSRDPDGVIVWYRWSWPNAAYIEARSIGYAFPHPQVVPVTLEVRDDRESQTSITREVAVDGKRTIGGRRVTIPPAFLRQNATTYEVEVLTGDFPNASTDARVFLALYELGEREGVVYGSGVMELSHGGDPFERGKKDVFQVTGRKIESLDHIVLLHDNSGENPGWYVTGLRVKELSSGKEWFFLPNRWLALDEADHKTYGEFTPVTNLYPAGIFVAGDRRSLGLVEVSDTVFIVPQGLERFYFTCLDGSRYMEVFRQNGQRLGYQNASSGKRTPPYLSQEEWGVAFEASSLTVPERFRIKAQKNGEVQEGHIWVFPSTRVNYRNEALRATLLLPFKGKTDAFLCAQETRN
ncbi:MAG: PLAT/LH2 domain-containing protein [Candidatus Caldatribacteriaceae bacterium]